MNDMRHSRKLDDVFKNIRKFHKDSEKMWIQIRDSVDTIENAIADGDIIEPKNTNDIVDILIKIQDDLRTWLKLNKQL